MFSAGLSEKQRCAMNLFAILRQHAADHPDAIAWQSARRIFTYRRFWSRIERATARLKGEWHVKPGDTVAYFGCGHPDALILYLAVARCGARLLPLEHVPLQDNVHVLLQQIPTVVLLHDDEIVFDAPPPAPVVAKLSALIATRCHYYPSVEDDDTRPSLISLACDDAMQPVAQSLHELSLHIDGGITGDYHVLGALFDAPVLAPCVLSVLVARGTVFFR
ncbi:MAG TPA: AMP-binding protein [Herminiimonas sp.]|nr:AMP-binding protein [Herminiimonas sp.]